MDRFYPKQDAWGNHEIRINAPLDSDEYTFYNEIAQANPFRYRSYYFDTETGFYYLPARYYDPAICRFISQDDHSYLDPESINGLNLYAYCLNNPVINFDPSGHIWDIVFDAASIAWSLYDFIKNPTWQNAGWLVLDIAFAIVPFLTASGLIKAASKLDEISYVGKGINKFDDVYDTIVLGNDMNRVMDRAFDIGATFYSGYQPLNALSAMHNIDNVTDAMLYAAKLDNARFIIDKVNAGYKIVHVGGDGRGFIKMMKSAYGMELKILYRLKIGNRLHKTWWILNSGRRILW